MAIIGPPSPPSPPPPTENVYTPSQFESVKEAFKHYLFKIIPAQLRPVFLILHDKEDNAYPSTDTRGRVLVRDDLIETELHNISRKCTNDGANAGAHSIKLEPAANSIVFIQSISSVNLDSIGVVHWARLWTAGAVLVSPLYYGTPAAGSGLVFPYLAAGYLSSLGNPTLFLTDDREINILTGTVQISEDTNFFISYSYIGDAPTITEVGPTNSVFSDVS